MAADKEPRALEKKVRERLAFIRKIVPFIAWATETLGRPRRDERGVRAMVTAECEVERFTFFYRSGETALGGNTVIVWYAAKSSQGADRVLELSWQTELRACEVKVFDASRSWQQALTALMRRKARIAAERRRAATSPERRRLRAERRADREAAIAHDARRLGIL